MSYRVIAVILVCWALAVAEEDVNERHCDLRLEQSVLSSHHQSGRYIDPSAGSVLPFATASGQLHIVRRDDGVWVGPAPDQLQQIAFGTIFTVPIVWGDGEAQYFLQLEEQHGWWRLLSSSMAIAETDGVRIALIDGDLDGRFSTVGADHMHIAAAGSDIQHEDIQPLAGAFFWEDRLWTLDDAAFPRIVMRPYDGSVTTVRLAPTAERIHGFSVTMVAADDNRVTGEWQISAGESMLLPSGDYRLGTVSMTVLGPTPEPQQATGLAGSWVGRLVGADRRQAEASRTWLRSRGASDLISLEAGEHDLAVGPPFTMHADPLWLHGALAVTEVGLRGQGGEIYRLYGRGEGAVPEWFLTHGDTSQSLGGLEYG